MTDTDTGFTPTDLDGDGTIDAYLQHQADGTTIVVLDSDGDGVIDTSALLDAQGNPLEVFHDTDGDGTPDVAYDAQGHETQLDDAGNPVQAAEPVADPTAQVPHAQDPAPGTPYSEDPASTEPASTEPTSTGPLDPQTDDQVVGDPFSKAQYWFEQSQNGWCGPATVAQIVAERTGVHDLHAVEATVVKTAMADGLLTKTANGPFDGWSGMTGPQLVQVFGDLGIPATFDHGSVQSLEQDLVAGREVIVAVDADEVWKNASGQLVNDDATDGGHGANHFVTVVGIDVTRGIVLLNDPGTPDGQLEAIPLENFESAWADSDHELIDVPPASDVVTAAPAQALDAHPAANNPVQVPLSTGPALSNQDPVQSPLAAVTGSAALHTAVDQPIPSVVYTPDHSVSFAHGATILPIVLSVPVAAATSVAGAALVAGRSARAADL